MIAGRRMVRESERALRARFAGYRPIDLARGPFMTARRVAASRRRWKFPCQRRAFQALNCMGVRIWADKPKQFGGMRWRAECATVHRSIEREERRAWYAVAQKWAGALGVEF